MNGVQKYVVSTTLEEPLEWDNSTLIKGNVAEEIAELKRQAGRDISISGSPTLVRSLLRDRLIDELRLMVHPVVVGGGKRLFEEGDQVAFELVDSQDHIHGRCHPARRPAEKEAEGERVEAAAVIGIRPGTAYYRGSSPRRGISLLPGSPGARLQGHPSAYPAARRQCLRSGVCLSGRCSVFVNEALAGRLVALCATASGLEPYGACECSPRGRS